MKYIFIFIFLSTCLGCQQSPINVSTKTIKVAEMGEHEFMLGFREGDMIVFSLNERQGKVINNIEIVEYPSGNLFYSEYNTSNLNHSFLVTKTGIFVFKLTNTALDSRFCEIKIDRTPKNVFAVSFNTTVFKRFVNDTTYSTSIEKKLTNTSYQTKTVINKESYYVNSISNEVWKGGKSRIAIPIILPHNTIDWYYTFTASRKEKQINEFTNQLNLVSELAYLVDQSGLVSFGIDMLSSPPGANYCDIYLLDYENYAPFTQGQEFRYIINGTRINFKSGVVKVNFTNNLMYLGIRNNDGFYGIHIALEVVAVVKEDVFEMVEVKTPYVSTREEYYLKN